jgi:hypothetical protein
MATLAARLTSVQSAIAKIENGAQTVTVNGRTVTYADIQKLYDQEEKLEKKIARAETGGRRSVAEM